AFGARPLARLIRTALAEPLSEEVLYGRLAGGGAVAVEVIEGEVVFTFPEVSGRLAKTKAPAEVAGA
ncbi:MAG: hypothetical protein VYE15_03135, partial [Myxococcota bacterium]|nr:hypothetical protein [Myxococcota bacterium]